MQRSIKLIVAASTLLVLGSSLVGVATPDSVNSPEGVSAPGQVTDSGFTILTEGDWTYFNYHRDLDFVEKVQQYKGKIIDGVCEYEGSRTLDPDQDVISVEREIAHNAVECIMITEVGFVREDRPLPDLDGAGFKTVEHSSSTVNETARLSSSAWHRTEYLDPVNLTVNNVVTRHNWTHNGTCVTGISGVNVSYYWLVATGWGAVYQNDYYDYSCSYARTQGYAEFFNGVFCVVDPTTRTRFSPNVLFGNPNGSYTVNWVTAKSGGCNDWLSFNSVAGI